MRLPELFRFAIGGLWRQKIRTALTLVAVAVGTAALAFSLSLGFGLRAFIDQQFMGKDDFWRILVRVAQPAADPGAIPADGVAVRGTMSTERKERMREALLQRYLTDAPRKPPILLTPDKVASVAALPDVVDVRTYRTDAGRIWLGDRTSSGFVVAGKLADLGGRLIAGQLPGSDDVAEIAISELALYDLGVRDDADLEAAVGRSIRVDVGAGARNGRPMALARALTGRLPDDQISRGQAEALAKVVAALPNSLDKFDLNTADRTALKALLERPPEREENSLRINALATGEYRIAGVIRLVTRDERKQIDRLAAWELLQGDVFLPGGTGEQLFRQLPGSEESGFHSAEVRVRPGGDLPATVAAVEAMGYEAISALRWFDSSKREVTLIAAGLNLFALVALFVAGVGITNTLVAGVIERTREIGILKAIGATRGQVMGIFLIEGVAIGLCGSAAGLALARTAAIPADGYVHRTIEQQVHGEKLLSDTIFVFPWWLWIGAVLFAVMVTTAAAYYPARRAARIDPIQALKYE